MNFFCTAISDQSHFLILKSVYVLSYHPHVLITEIHLHLRKRTTVWPYPTWTASSITLNLEIQNWNGYWWFTNCSLLTFTLNLYMCTRQWLFWRWIFTPGCTHASWSLAKFSYFLCSELATFQGVFSATAGEHFLSWQRLRFQGIMWLYVKNINEALYRISFRHSDALWATTLVAHTGNLCSTEILNV